MTAQDPQEANVKSEYAAPSIKVLGSLAELTLRGKEFGRPNDGDFFLHNRSIGMNS